MRYVHTYTLRPLRSFVRSANVGPPKTAKPSLGRVCLRTTTLTAAINRWLRMRTRSSIRHGGSTAFSMRSLCDHWIAARRYVVKDSSPGQGIQVFDLTRLRSIKRGERKQADPLKRTRSPATAACDRRGKHVLATGLQRRWRLRRTSTTRSTGRRTTSSSTEKPASCALAGHTPHNPNRWRVNAIDR